VTHTIPLEFLSGQLLLAAEARKVRDEKAEFLFGTEYSYQHLASFQFGYRSGLDTQDVSFGFGVGHGNVSGQYAYVPMSENLGTSSGSRCRCAGSRRPRVIHRRRRMNQPAPVKPDEVGPEAPPGRDLPSRTLTVEVHSG